MIKKSAHVKLINVISYYCLFLGSGQQANGTATGGPTPTGPPPMISHSTNSTVRPLMTDIKKSVVAQQLGLSVSVVAGSVMGGMFYLMKKEQFKLRTVRGAGNPAGYAAKAFLIGTAFTLGSFAVGVGAFVTLTGVSSIHQFGDWVDKTCRTEEGYRRLMQRREIERKRQEEFLRNRKQNMGFFEELWEEMKSEDTDLQHISNEVEEELTKEQEEKQRQQQGMNNNEDIRT
jgi:hypothetical protein